MRSMVLLSGGLDSSTCLAMIVQREGKENVLALTVFYGQRHKREIKAARDIADYYGVEHIELDLAKMFEGSNCPLIAASGEKIPEGSYDEQLKEGEAGKPVATYVPFRNGLFLSVAASLALVHNCKVIYYGIHKDDAAGSAYPDCSIAFNDAMGRAIKEGTGNQVEISAPFVGVDKAEVVKVGLELGVPYELTWSCYEGDEEPCGKCGTCIDRINAFKQNGKDDPIYADR